MNQTKIFENIEPTLTFDVDWAPDFVIEYVVKKLNNLGIKSTWFITHDSPEIQKLIDNPLVEIGLHPNFQNNSTQGDGIDNILKNLKNIANDAKSIRTHGLLQSSSILLKYNKHEIENDVSILFSNEPNIVPHYSDFLKITRIPFYWEDDVEISNNNQSAKIEKHFSIPGIKIFDFHPIHIFLNSNNMENYEKMKNEKYPDVDENKLKEFRNDLEGVDTIFSNFIEFLTKNKTHTINDISKMFNEWRVKNKQ